jgi:hypothetical protein
MPDEFPMNDPRRIWQDQPTEVMKMSLDEVRRRAQKLELRDRLSTLASIVIGFFLFFLCIWFARIGAGLAPRIGWAMLSLWALYYVYQAYKWVWPGRLAADATFSTSLEFYRKELERKRDYGRHIWRRAGLTFCFAGLAFVVIPALVEVLKKPRLPLNLVPFFALLVIWSVVFFSMRRRRQRNLQKEIDDL